MFAIEFTPVIVASSIGPSKVTRRSVGNAVETRADTISIPPGKVVVVVVDKASDIISSIVSSTVTL